MSIQLRQNQRDPLKTLLGIHINVTDALAALDADPTAASISVYAEDCEANPEDDILLDNEVARAALIAQKKAIEASLEELGITLS